MKRFLVILFLFATSSCELPTIIQADKYIEPVPIKVTDTIPVYETVWDRIKDDVQSEQDKLDEKTLDHININMIKCFFIKFILLTLDIVLDSIPNSFVNWDSISYLNWDRLNIFICLNNSW